MVLLLSRDVVVAPMGCLRGNAESVASSEGHGMEIGLTYQFGGPERCDQTCEEPLRQD